MTEALAGGSIENGGPPKAPSPVIKGGVEQRLENPILDIPSPPSVASANIGDTTVQSIPAADSTASPLPQPASTPDSPSISAPLSSSSQTHPIEESSSQTHSAPADAHPTEEALSSASTSGTADPTSAIPAQYEGAIDVPCMRAVLNEETDGSYSIVGSWGMTAGAHDTEGHTSPFELRSSPPSTATTPDGQSRYSGVYSGFFMLMQGAGKAPLKVDEKKVHLTFISNSAGGFNIQGTGKNRFGQFTMHGSMSSNKVELFRAYPTKAEKPKSEGRKKASKTASVPAPISVTLSSSNDPAKPAAGSPSGGMGGKSIQQLSISIQKPVAEDTDAVSPGRAKRATAGDWKSKADIAANRDTTGPSRKGKGKEHATVSEANDNSNDGISKPGRVRRLPSHLQEIPDDKPVRLNEHLRKCLTILRELSKNPSAHWFAQPVDWRFFGLLDYPKVIKEPMDFATIRSQIETGEITTPEDYKKAMLLVFRNAMTYNSKRDNIVHIAAREIQALFEEKYRTQIEAAIIAAAEKQAEAVEKQAAAEVVVPKPARGRKAGSGGGPGSGRGRKAAKVGDEAKPKPGAQGGGMVPQARFVALQQQMEMMQAQLETLKRQTSQTDLNVQAQMQFGGQSSSGGGGGAKKNVKPMTADERNALKQGISSLPPEKLPRVLEIIKEREGYVGGGDEDIEIDLDMMDPPTLHVLQRYVKSCAPRKRKKPTPANHSNMIMEEPKLSQSSNGLPDMDVDIGTLEEHAFDIDIVDTHKRGRTSFDPILNYDAYGLPEGLDSESDV